MVWSCLMCSLVLRYALPVFDVVSCGRLTSVVAVAVSCLVSEESRELTSDVMVKPMTSIQPSSWRCGSKSWCSLGCPQGIVPAQYLQHTHVTSLGFFDWIITSKWSVKSFPFLLQHTWGCWGRAGTVASSPGLWLSGLFHHTLEKTSHASWLKMMLFTLLIFNAIFYFINTLELP